MVTKVGSIEYDVTLDTGKLIGGSRQVGKELDGMAKKGDALTQKLSQITIAIGSLSSALYVIAKADAFTKMNAQLSLATNSTRELGIAQAETKKIATEAQADLLSVSNLYAKISNATGELGISQQKVGEITRATALALKVSGATASESNAAIMQLGQAFASGVLRGDEFNSVAESSPRLMKALADGIGVPIGALREMAAQGKLTSEVLATALPKALKDLEGEARQIQTISGAFQQLNNEIMLFIGQQTTSSGAAKLTADAIGALANNLDLLAAAALGVAAAKLAGVLLAAGSAATRNTIALVESVAAQRAAIAASQAAAAATMAETSAKLYQLSLSQSALVISRSELAAKLAANTQTLAQAAAQLAAAKSAGAMSFALAMVREAEMTTAAAQAARLVIMKQMAVLGAQQASVTAALTTATAAHTAAQAANTAALGASSVTASLASRALAAMGGPIGLISTLLGLGATAWALWGDSASDASKKASDEMEASGREILASLEKQNAKLRERLELAKAGNVDAAKSGSKDAERLASTLAEINALKAKGAALTGSDQIQLAELEGRYRDISAALAENKKLKGDIEQAGQQSKASEWAAKYATDIERVNAEIEKAKKELGDAFTPELEQRIRAKIIPEKKTSKAESPNDKYTEQLQKQIEKEQELTAVQQLGMDINAGRLGNLTVTQQNNLVALAQRVDRLKEEKDAQDAVDKAYEEGLKIQQDSIKQDSDRNKSLAESNTALRLQVEEIGLTKEALRALELQRIDDAIAIKQQEVARAGEAGASDAELQRIQQTIDLLKQKRELTATGQIKQATADAAETSQKFADDLQTDVKNALSTAFRDSKNPGKAFADAFANVLYTRAANALAASLTSSLFGGGGILSSVGSLFGFGGGRAYGGPTSAGTMYKVNETGQPEMFTGSNGSQYMLPTTNGTVTPANEVGGGNTYHITQSFTVGDVASVSMVQKAVKASQQQLIAALNRSNSYS